MAGSDSSTRTNLRDLVAAGDKLSLLDAVDLAVTRSVSQVRAELDEDFLDENAEAATRFFAMWLPRLGAYERMEAANWASGQFLTSMVHVDHSYGVGARMFLEALAEATRATATSLAEFRGFATGPDAEVAESVADRFDRLAATLREVHAEVSAELSALPADTVVPEA